MKNMYSAGIVTYTIKDGKPIYLLLHYTAGHWDFPKGTMETGETKEETAIRELYEETGLTVELDTSFETVTNYFYNHYQFGTIPKTVYFFVGKTENKHVRLSHEHIDFLWLPYEESLTQLTYENAQEILEKAHRYITKESNR